MCVCVCVCEGNGEVRGGAGGGVAGEALPRRFELVSLAVHV